MSGESNTFGFNPSKQKFERVETDGSHALKVFQVNSSSGTTFNGVIKANDGNDGAGTNRTIKCDEQGILETHIIGTDNAGDQSEHRVKVNDNGEIFTQIRANHFTTLPTLTNGQSHQPLMDTKARLLTKSTLSGLTDIADETTGKNVIDH